MDPRPTFRELIALRKRELEHMLVAARGHVAQIEAEIAEVEQAEKALPRGSGPLPGRYELKGSEAELVHGRHQHFAQMTIKQVVMQALRDKHPDGLDTTQLGEFIRNAYNRAIAPDSLRPQLARLKSDGLIVARENVWHLTKQALVWDHPKSVNLNDEPSESETAANRFTESVRAVHAALSNPKK